MNNCSSCAFAINGKTNCAILNTTIYDPEHNLCSLHTKEPQTCAYCGRIILPHHGVYIPEISNYVCEKCGEYMYTCATCKHHQKAPQCLISKYHGPLDALIEETIQINQFMQATTTQINPQVIEQVCPDCKCGSPWNCQRNHKCDNWEVNL